MRHPYLDGPYPRAYTHRGWHIGDLTGCENTLAGFHRAVAEGYAYVELDVHPTRDGGVVVHHDPRLDRTTDGCGAIAEQTTAEVTTARVAGREPVPELEQVLAELPHTRFTIELKARAVVEPVLDLLGRLDAWDRVCLGSFAEPWLRVARRAGGERLLTSMGQASAFGLRTRAWLDGLPLLSTLPAPPFRGGVAHLPRRFGLLTVVDAGLLSAARAAGIEVHVWTVDTPAEIHELLDLGVDGLVTDRPDVLRDVLRERGVWAS